MKRPLLIAFLAASLLGTTGGVSFATPLPDRTQMNAPSPIIHVDRRCGPGRRWVPAHRVRGRTIRGACVRVGSRRR